MFQMLTGISLLGLLAFPVLIIIIYFYQNLIEEQRTNIKPKPVVKTQYQEELEPIKLRAVK